MSLKKIVKENIFTKKRRCLELNERTKEHSFINPTVGVYSKNNMITFNNLTFVNEEGMKFTGNFSLIYKITDYVKFSYHKNYAEVLKSIVEAYLQNLFNNVNYYDKFVFSPIKIKAELNMLVSKYIEGINVIDVSDLNVENHFNLTFEEDTIVEPDSFIELNNCFRERNFSLENNDDYEEINKDISRILFEMNLNDMLGELVAKRELLEKQLNGEVSLLIY